MAHQSTLIADDSANAGSGVQPGWPAFFPDSQSVVYHHQSVASQDRFDVFPTIYTRGGADAQIYWTNLSGPAAVTPLDNLNGKGYLPKLTTPSALSCMADSMQMGGGVPDPVYGGISNPDLDHADDATVPAGGVFSVQESGISMLACSPSTVTVLAPAIGPTPSASKSTRLRSLMAHNFARETAARPDKIM